MESEAHKLFVGGILRETVEEDLKQHFSRYGAVLGAVVPRVRGSGTPRCFAFVWFADSVSVDRALRDTHIIRGRRVDVRKAVAKNEQPHVQVQQQQQSQHCNQSQENSAVNGESSDTDRKIFVGGLPSSLTEEELKSYFEQFGQITDAVVMYDKLTGRPRGFGFVTFDSQDSIEKVTRNSFHELNNKSVEVKRAVRKEDIQNSNIQRYFGYGRGYNGSNHVQYPHPVAGMHFHPLLQVYNGGFHDPSQAEIYLPDGNFLPGRHWDNHNTLMHGYGYLPAAYANNPSYGFNTNGMTYYPSYDLNANGVIYNSSYGVNTNGVIFNPNVNYYVPMSGVTTGELDGLNMNAYGYTSGVWHPNSSIPDSQLNKVGEMNAGVNNPESATTEPKNKGDDNVQNPERNSVADNLTEDSVTETDQNENGYVDVLSAQVNDLKLAEEETRSQTSDGHDQRSP